jgi:hypothetical protein
MIRRPGSSLLPSFAVPGFAMPLVSGMLTFSIRYLTESSLHVAGQVACEAHKCGLRADRGGGGSGPGMQGRCCCTRSPRRRSDGAVSPAVQAAAGLPSNMVPAGVPTGT